MNIFKLLMVVLAFACTLFPATASATSKGKAHKPDLAILYDALDTQLAKGGQIIFLAAPASDQQTQPSSAPNWWRACELLRPNAAGNTQLKMLNWAFRTLSFPIGLIRSSDACISLTSATATVGNPELRVYPTTDLNAPTMFGSDKPIDGVIQTRLHGHFETGTWTGTNTILSGHNMTPTTAPHPALSDMQPGDSAIFVFMPDGQISLLARLTPKQWVEMAQYRRRIPSSKVKY
jgi:hypothetical protein